MYQSIASHHRCLRLSELRYRQTIHDQVIGHQPQPPYRALHCQVGRAQNIEAVNLMCTRGTDSQPQGSPFDLDGEALAGRGGETLRVVRPIDSQVGRQDECDREDGAGQGAASCLIDTRKMT
jgi:hypothetical protein